jgi:hypothetical protein
MRELRQTTSKRWRFAKVRLTEYDSSESGKLQINCQRLLSCPGTEDTCHCAVNGNARGASWRWEARRDSAGICWWSVLLAASQVSAVRDCACLCTRGLVAANLIPGRVYGNGATRRCWANGSSSGYMPVNPGMVAIQAANYRGA